LSLTLLGLAVASFVELPAIAVSSTFLGSSTTIHLSGTFVVGVALIALVVSGFQAQVRSHPSAPKGSLLFDFSLAALPGLLLFLALFFLPRLSGTTWVMALVSFGFLLYFVLLAQWYTIDALGHSYWIARVALNLIAYAVGALLYVAIYGMKVRSLLSATGMVFASVLLALELLRGQEAKRTWLYASVSGLIMGELLWALNYWGVGAMAGGSILLLSFYLVSVLLRQNVYGEVRRSLVLELLLVVGVGLALLWRAFPWTW
jgi:hypothetical protein